MFSRNVTRFLRRSGVRYAGSSSGGGMSPAMMGVGGAVVVGGVYYMNAGSSSVETDRSKSTNTYVDGWKSTMERCIIRRILAEKSEDEIKELRSRKTKQGWDLDKLTICGTKHGHRKAGVYCGDEDTYTTFKDILDPLVKEYHSIDIDANKQTRETYDTVTLPTLPEGSEIISTRIRCARSVAPFPMTVNMTKQERLDFEAMMMEIFKELEGDLKGTYYGHTVTDKARLDQLVQEHKLFCDDDECLKDGGCYDDWPAGRGIYMNEAETFMVWVGEEDHLRVMSMKKGTDVQGVWNEFYSGLEAIDKGLQKRGSDFMFDERLGYVNCCPSNLGTGMRASVHVKLPKYDTRAKVAAALEASPMAGKVQARGTHGESKNTDGSCIYDISNWTRIGNCSSLIKDMIDGVVYLS